MTDDDIHKAVKMLSNSRAKDTADLQRQFIPHLTIDTIQKALEQAGLQAYVHQLKPLLTKQHIKRRLDWAERHCYWDGEDWWAVVFSDESKLNLFGQTAENGVGGGQGKHMTQDTPRRN